MSRKTTTRHLVAGTAITTAAALLCTGLAFAEDAPTPSISSLSITSGPLAGGSSAVEITGTGLDKVAKVWFGDRAAASVAAASSTSLFVTPPVGDKAEKVEVTLGASKGDATDATTNDYTYTAGPTVTGVALGTDKKSLEISGTQLTGATTVLFGDTAVKVSKADKVEATKITLAKAPSLKLGAVTVAVVTPTGVGSEDAAWGAAPVASKAYTLGKDKAGKETKVAVTTIDAKGGSAFFVDGTGFTRTTSVTIGKAAASFAVVNDSLLRVVAPAKDAGDTYPDKTPNSVKVGLTVTNSFGSSDPKKVQVTYGAVPTVTGLDTTVGFYSSTANSVTITGTNLKGAKVAFGKLAAKADATAKNTETSLTVIVGKADKDTKADIALVTDGGATYVVGSDGKNVQYTWSGTDPKTTKTPWPAVSSAG